MRRAIVTGTATISGVVLLLGLKPHGASAPKAQSFSIGSSAGPAATAPSPSASTSASARSGSTTSGSGSRGSSPTTAPAVSASKVVIGDTAETRYGPLQLQVTFSGRKITGINVLRYPQESYRDQQINSYALPQLNQEAIAAQSANIDVVSGATYTSEGYEQSLQSAIDKAGT